MMTSLEDLTWHWEGTYEFSHSGRVWSARPVDAPAEILTADSADALRVLVRQDHAARYSTERPGAAKPIQGPVPRPRR
jgi:hypothetical protein